MVFLEFFREKISKDENSLFGVGLLYFVSPQRCFSAVLPSTFRLLRLRVQVPKNEDKDHI